jgi:hypothetical protein
VRCAGKVFTLLFRFIPFRIIWNYVLIQRKITKYQWEENEVYGAYIEITFISCILSLSMFI